MTPHLVNASWFEEDVHFEVKSRFVNYLLRQKGNYIRYYDGKKEVGYYKNKCTKKFEDALSKLISDQIKLIQINKVPESIPKSGVFFFNGKEHPFYMNNPYQPGLTTIGQRFGTIVNDAIKECK